jgi:hypothetical protein
VLASFAHEAVVELVDDGDPRAPGGAITVALCGTLDHEPPCPLAPHQTSTSATEQGLAVRIVFAAAVEDVAEVHRRIERALAAGEYTGPDGRRTAWQLVADGGASPVQPTEADLAARLVGTR